MNKKKEEEGLNKILLLCGGWSDNKERKKIAGLGKPTNRRARPFIGSSELIT